MTPVTGVTVGYEVTPVTGVPVGWIIVEYVPGGGLYVVVDVDGVNVPFNWMNYLYFIDKLNILQVMNLNMY